MKDEVIKEIGVDKKGRLLVKPQKTKFQYIYREAMEVHWDNENNALCSPPPREWTYLDWYKQIIKAAKEQGTNLLITNKTEWVNVSTELQNEIKKNR